MAKIAVVTDSTAYLSKEIIEKYNIHVVPLTVHFDHVSYKEIIDISSIDFYEKIKGLDEMPTTSQPAIGEFIKMYERLAKDYDQAIAIHLSSGISGAMNTSQTAANMVDGIDVTVIDSEVACYPLGFMAIEAAEMAQQGKSMEEIKARIEILVDKMRAYIVVDDLEHLHRGGRLNAAQLVVGSMLQIKPIIHFEDKKLVPFEKVRTKKKAFKRILEKFDQDAKDGDKIKASIVQANAMDEANELLEYMQSKYPNAEVNISDFGPVIGTHTGSGTIGIGWYVV